MSPLAAGLAAIAAALRLDMSAASRRVRVAVDRGHLRNLEDRKGRPLKIALGDPLPKDAPILPAPEALIGGCTVAGETEGIPPPSPPTDGADDGRGEGGDTPPGAPATAQPLLVAREPDPATLRMARELAAFGADELAAYRAELANPPADDPPSAEEWAALALAERMRTEEAA